MKSEIEGRWRASHAEIFTFPKIHNPTESSVCKEMSAAQIYSPLFFSQLLQRQKAQHKERNRKREKNNDEEKERERQGKTHKERERQKARTRREVNRQEQKRGMRLWSRRQEKGGGSAEWEEQRCVSGMCVRERTPRPSHTPRPGRPAEPSQGETLDSPEPWGHGRGGVGSYAVGGAKQGWSSEEDLYWGG